MKKLGVLLVLIGGVMLLLGFNIIPLRISDRCIISTKPFDGAIYSTLSTVEVIANKLTPTHSITGITYTQNGDAPINLVSSDETHWSETVTSPSQGEHDYSFSIFGTPLGDLNNDGVIDIQDIEIGQAAYGSYDGHALWNPAADLDLNGKIDILDMTIIAENIDKLADAAELVGSVDGSFTISLTDIPSPSIPQPTPIVFPDLELPPTYNPTLIFSGAILMVVGIGLTRIKRIKLK